MQLNGHVTMDGNGQDQDGWVPGMLRVEISADQESPKPVVDPERSTFEAGYISTAPITWVAFDSQTYAVTLINRGTHIWPMAGSNPVQLGVHFGDASERARQRR